MVNCDGKLCDTYLLKKKIISITSIRIQRVQINHKIGLVELKSNAAKKKILIKKLSEI